MGNTIEMIDSDCIGSWEKNDVICNGDPKAKSVEDKRACGWKKRCRAFTRHIKGNEKTPEDFLIREKDENDESIVIPKDGMEKFKKFCDNLIEESNERLKRKKKKSAQFDKNSRDGRWSGPSESAKRNAASALKGRAKERRKILIKMLAEFRTTLNDLLKNNSFAIPGKVVMPGQLFLSDKMNTSGYISIYCKVPAGRNVPVVSFRIKTASLTFDAKLPFTVKELEEYCSKSAMTMLSPIPENIGSFKSIANHLDQEKIILLAEVIAKLVSSGKMVFPADANAS